MAAKLTKAQMLKKAQSLTENLNILKRELRKKTLAPQTLDELRDRYEELLTAKIGGSFSRKN